MSLFSASTFLASCRTEIPAAKADNATMDRHIKMTLVGAIIDNLMKLALTPKKRPVSTLRIAVNTDFWPILTVNDRMLNNASPTASGTSFIKAT